MISGYRPSCSDFLLDFILNQIQSLMKKKTITPNNIIQFSHSSLYRTLLAFFIYQLEETVSIARVLTDVETRLWIHICLRFIPLLLEWVIVFLEKGFRSVRFAQLLFILARTVGYCVQRSLTGMRGHSTGILIFRSSILCDIRQVYIPGWLLNFLNVINKLSFAITDFHKIPDNITLKDCFSRCCCHRSSFFLSFNRCGAFVLI